MLHKLLQRQIAKYLKAFDSLSAEQARQLQEFLTAVEDSYTDFERDRKIAERSMELSSKELFEANRDLRLGNEEVQSLYRILTTVQTTDPIEKTCAAILPEIQSFSDFPIAVVELYRSDKKDLEIIAQLGLSDELQEKQNRQVWQKNSATSCCSVPIDSPTGIIGLLTIADIKVHHPRNDRLFHWLNVVASQIGSLMERKRLDELMRQQQTNMLSESKMSELGKMAGSIAHEINTPLATISLMTEQLKDVLTSTSVDLDMAARCADIIGLTTDRIAKIILALRTFSRDGSSDVMEPAKILNIVNDTINLCQEHLKMNCIELTVNVPDHLEIRGRPTQISQVILNLLNNSQDAIEGTTEKWIKVEAREVEESVLLTITDSGCGISTEIRDKLFDPFFTTKGIGKGTGLGLSISDGIIKSHGGKLAYDVTSDNTCFVVHLPKA